MAASSVQVVGASPGLFRAVIATLATRRSISPYAVADRVGPVAAVRVLDSGDIAVLVEDLDEVPGLPRQVADGQALLGERGGRGQEAL